MRESSPEGVSLSSDMRDPTPPGTTAIARSGSDEAIQNLGDRLDCVASLAMTSQRSSPIEFVATILPGDLVEHRIEHAGLLTLDEGVGDIDIFRTHDAGGHVLAVLQLIGAGAQHGALDSVDPL